MLEGTIMSPRHLATVVRPLFADQRVHICWPGAVLNAKCVINGLEQLSNNPLAQYYKAANRTLQAR